MRTHTQQSKHKARFSSRDEAVSKWVQSLLPAWSVLDLQWVFKNKKTHIQGYSTPVLNSSASRKIKQRFTQEFQSNLLRLIQIEIITSPPPRIYSGRQISSQSACTDPRIKTVMLIHFSTRRHSRSERDQWAWTHCTTWPHECTCSSASRPRY